ncbi:MAG: hypothetical protein WC998_08590 [Candidatus Paceibacterota bacterium]|jgi:hypothetical protein
MLGKLLVALFQAVAGDLFKKKPWRLWGIKQGMKAWRNFGTGSARRLNLYAQVLFVEGWRTLIIGKDITEPAVPPNNGVKNV